MVTRKINGNVGGDRCLDGDVDFNAETLHNFSDDGLVDSLEKNCVESSEDSTQFFRDYDAARPIAWDLPPAVPASARIRAAAPLRKHTTPVPGPLMSASRTGLALHT